MTKKSSTLGAVTVALLCAMPCLAGQPQKWDDLPDPVRTTVLANGGTAGQQVDKENGTKNGMAIYEAGTKDKNGDIADLVITADGKLVETKHDDEANLAPGRAERAKKL